MSLNYLAIPVTEDVWQWGHELGLPLPAQPLPSRFPTTTELVSALESIDGHGITTRKLDDPICITLESFDRIPIPVAEPVRNTDAPRSLLTVNGRLHPATAKKLFSMHGDYELVVLLLQRLYGTTGPFCCFESGDGLPLFILSADDEPIGLPG